MVQSTPDEPSVRGQLKKILESDSFNSSPLLARFLSFTVDQTLNGNTEVIKESTLGSEVCGRSNFDPRYDSVVRTTATRLRSKLSEYYSNRPDVVRIDYPRGSYIPVFSSPAGEPGADSQPLVENQKPFWWQPALLGALCAAVLGGGAWLWMGRTQPKQEITRRFSLGLPPGIAPSSLVSSGPAVISPDGRLVAVSYLQTGSPNYRIFLHDLESGLWRPLHDKDIRGFHPVWSPDSRELLYGNNSTMFRIRTDGTQLQVVAEIPGGFNSAAWSDQGQILFSSQPLAGLSLVPASGGKPVSITKPQRPAELWHYSPNFLPGGKEFIYTVVGPERSLNAVYVASLLQPDGRTKLLTGASSASYLPIDRSHGMLVYQGPNSLMAVPYHADRRELEGEPFAIGSAAAMDVSRGLGDFSVSNDGTLLVRTGTAVQLRQLRIVDSGGRSLHRSANQQLFRFPSLSPDGSQIATGVIDHTTGLETVWILDRDLKNLRKLVPGTVSENSPRWSPDGKRIAFIRGGEIHVAPASGSAPAAQLTYSGGTKNTSTWTPDGKEILYYEYGGSERRNDIMAIAAAPGATPRAIVSTSANENDVAVSPDGKYIVFLSDEGGKLEVHMQNYPKPDDTARRHLVQVSTGGGYSPHFGSNGTEVLYVAGDNRKMMSVAVRDGAVIGGPRVHMETPDWFHRGYGLHCLPAGAPCVISAPGDDPQLSPPLITLHPKWSSQR